MSIRGRNKHIWKYPFNELLLCNKKEQFIDVYKNKYKSQTNYAEKKHKQKRTYSIVSFV